MKVTSNNVLTFLVVVAAFVVTAVFARVPTGKYCCDANGIVNGTADFTNSTSADLELTLIQAVTSCPGEPYTYYPSNGSIIFPEAFNPNNCLGQLLATFGVADSTATYIPVWNVIMLGFPMNITFPMLPC